MVCAAVARKYGSHGERGMLFAVRIGRIRANIKRTYCNLSCIIQKASRLE